MSHFVLENLKEAARALDALMGSSTTLRCIDDAGKILSTCFKNGGHVYSAGNGGSMCDAMHFAEELSGKFRHNRKALGAIAISDAGFLTCTANDYGYEHVFSRFLEAQGRTGDVFLGISTSGKSKNIIRAAETAKKMGLNTICLTGQAGSDLAQFADVEICTPGGTFADRIQELHIKVIHILIELVERNLFPENYK